MTVKAIWHKSHILFILSTMLHDRFCPLFWGIVILQEIEMNNNRIRIVTQEKKHTKLDL